MGCSGGHSRGTGGVFDINEKGQFCGSIGNQACYWDEFGNAHLLAAPAGWMSSARTLNNVGQFAGFVEKYPDEHGAIWDEYGLREIPSYGQFSGIRSINDNGIASGFSDGSHPLRWNGTSWEALPSLGGYNSIGGINQAGTIVGQSNGQAVLWDADGIHIIGMVPGWERSYAGSINNNGVVVGGTVYSGSYGRGWVWDGSDMQVLNPLPGDDFSEANDINDSGWIIGMSGCYSSGYPRAVAWIPVPEPSAMLTMLGATGCLAGVLRRKR